MPGSGSNGSSTGLAVQAWIAWQYSRHARTIAVSMYMCSMYVCVIGKDDRDMGGGGTAQCMGSAAMGAAALGVLCRPGSHGSIVDMPGP